MEINTISSAPSDQSLRAPASCNRCKQRKSRCDRGLPNCKRCEEAAVSCEYLNRRRPGFAAGYRKVLESRIEELEAEVESLRFRPLAEGRAGVAQPVSGMQLDAPIRSTAVSEGRDPAPSTSTYDDDQHELRKPLDRVFQATFPRTSKIVERQPPLDLVVSSVSVFFRHIHPWFPVLDVQRILVELAGMRDASLVHLAVFGSSLPFLFDPRLDQTTSDSFWKYTKRRIFIETAEEPSYASLEASTILALDLSGMTNGSQVSGRLAVITRLAFHLRSADELALRPSVQDDQNPQVMSPGFKQHARLFWAIYALDSIVSITTRQPPGLGEHDLRRFLSTRDAVWDAADQGDQQGTWAGPDHSHMSPAIQFLYLLKLLDISRDIHAIYLEYLTLPEDDNAQAVRWLERFIKHAEASEMWLRALPRSMDLATDSARISSSAVMQHAYGHALTIYLNSLVEFCHHPSLALHLVNSRKDAQERCAKSVRAITDIASRFVDIKGDRVGWPFAWSMWVAARYLLLASFHASSALPPQFQTLLSYTYKMGRYWQISKKYWWLLRRGEYALNTRYAAGRLGTPRILASIVDLRVPTSDIEDQFRVDPVLSCRTDPQGAPTNLDETSSPDELGPTGMEAVNFHFTDGSEFRSASYISETWFNMPLSASSAYQEFPGEDMSGGAASGTGWEFIS